ncbi:conserved membrane hypothetical protein [Vibrio chagasii]|uniref:hypothetical protein n=1 Tax=Vibrio chagasii TaxID=170679 RepID=UPI00337614F9|nr:conserved membrane hypothetical protein [Vibrio chagasii]CAH6933303.1 conserved membrane hypothetical protein [Vibrio chagasii]CAH7037453.1 conserved membrane hypothetical protein [Vibrio chagasii]CAH7062501.1 conserved membrane hypothetical protein [Vibrio chagasii]CAH7090082.1 conserved membrane hypothetical protein [Vibrio chagasii]
MIRSFKLLLCVIFFLQPWLLSGIIRFEVLVVLIASVFLLLTDKFRLSIVDLLYILFSGVIVLAYTIFHSEFDYSLFNVFIKLSILFLGAKLLVDYTSFDYSDLLIALRIVVSLSLIFYFLAVLVPIVRDIAMLLKGETYGLENKLEVYRLWFPSSAHTFHLGVFYFTVIAIQLLNKEKAIWIIPTLICASISSRSALMVGLVLVIVNAIQKDRRLLILLVASLSLFAFFFYDIVESSMSARYALEPIINLVENGQLESKSTDTFQDKHLYMPNDKQIIFGDGRYFQESGKFYGGTDSGIMRPLLFGGMFFQGFYLVTMFLILRKLYVGTILSVAIVLSYYVMNVKAEFLIPGPHFALLSFYYFQRIKGNHL